MTSPGKYTPLVSPSWCRLSKHSRGRGKEHTLDVVVMTLFTSSGIFLSYILGPGFYMGYRDVQLHSCNGRCQSGVGVPVSQYNIWLFFKK